MPSTAALTSTTRLARSADRQQIGGSDEALDQVARRVTCISCGLDSAAQLGARPASGRRAENNVAIASRAGADPRRQTRESRSKTFVKTRADSVCYGACAALGTQLITKGKPIAAPRRARLPVGRPKRKEASSRFTYKGTSSTTSSPDRSPPDDPARAFNPVRRPVVGSSAAGKEIHMS